MDRGDRDGATERLARAASLADALSAVPLREQIGSLAKAGSPQPSPTGPAAQARTGGVFGLTAREIEALRLVAAGRSNRDIAAELFYSRAEHRQRPRLEHPGQARRARAAPRPRPSPTWAVIATEGT